MENTYFMVLGEDFLGGAAEALVWLQKPG